MHPTLALIDLPTVILIVLGILGIVLLGIVLSFFSVWLRAWLAGAYVGFTDLVAMRLRQVPYGVIVDARITATKAGIEVGVFGGVVVLSGRVRDVSTKHRILRSVEDAPRVGRIVDKLVVNRSRSR